VFACVLSSQHSVFVDLNDDLVLDHLHSTSMYVEHLYDAACNPQLRLQPSLGSSAFCGTTFIGITCLSVFALSSKFVQL
jgi:hypothetical protein